MLADRTLFIDSDCLCFLPAQLRLPALRGSQAGRRRPHARFGLWFCDIAKTRERFNLGPLPHFNGGLYYLERGSEVTALYQRARALEAQYAEIGLIRLRGRPNDEILISLAIAERGWAPVPEDGTILGIFDTIYPVVEQLDVLSGHLPHD